MDKMCIIPEIAVFAFNWRRIPQLADRVFRILWISISLGHLRDDHFIADIATVTRVIKQKQPKNFREFIHIIHTTNLRNYGSYNQWTLNLRWWRQVWRLIKYDEHIKIMYKGVIDE